MLDFLVSLVIFFSVLYIFDNIRVKEVAVTTCARLCRQQGFRLLDETVVKQSTKPIRDQSRLFRVRRDYDFQYTLDGLSRLNGNITMLGQQVVAVHFEHSGYQQTLPA